ncbi:hypothetical protein CR513_30077, partial [Mucuna pruriens]
MSHPMSKSWEGEDGRGFGVGSVEDRGHESSESSHTGTLKVKIVQLENEQKRKVGQPPIYIYLPRSASYITNLGILLALHPRRREATTKSQPIDVLKDKRSKLDMKTR